MTDKGERYEYIWIWRSFEVMGEQAMSAYAKAHHVIN